jgi:hypothetical protein
MRRFLLIVLVATTGCSVTTPSSTTTTEPATTTTLSMTTTQATTTSPITTTSTVPVTTTTTSTPTGQSPSIIPQARSDESSLFRLTVITPVVQNVEDAPTINTAITDTIGRAVDRFLVEAAHTGTEEIAGPNLLQITYQTGALTHTLVSLELDVSTYWSGAAHPSSTTTTLTFIDAAPVNVVGYLADPEGFARVVASHIADAYGSSTDGVLDAAGGADGLLALAHLLVTDDGLIAAFDQYAVAAGAAGIVRVAVPFDQVTLTDPLASAVPGA